MAHDVSQDVGTVLMGPNNSAVTCVCAHVLPRCVLQALLDMLLQYTDAGVATSDDAVVLFEEVAVLAPRGRFQVEMHASFLKLVGQVSVIGVAGLEGGLRAAEFMPWYGQRRCAMDVCMPCMACIQ